MNDPNVKLIFTAESAQAEAAMARIERRLRKIEALTKRGGKGPAAGLAGGFNAAATAVGRFALSLAGLGSPLQAAFTIINQIRIAIDGLRAAQEEAARTNITFESALSQAFLNLDIGDRGIPNIEKLQEIINGVSRRTGVDPTGVALALSKGFSARGDFSSLDVVKAVEKTLNLVRSFPEDQRAFIAGSVLDIRKVNPNITEEGALGFISAAATRSRVTEIGVFSKNVIGPIVSSALGERNPSGEDLRFTAALAATISQLMVDIRGRRAGTAQIQITRRIKELIRSTPAEDLPPGFEDNLLGRLRAVQQNPELRAKIGKQIENAIGELTAGGFLLKGRFSVKARDVLEGLLSGEGRAAELFDSSLAFIPNPQSQAAIDREAELRKNLQRSKPALVGQTERELKAATDRERLRRLQPALAGAIRPGLREFLESQGVLQQLIDLKIAEFDIGTGVGSVDSLQSVIEILKQRAKSLLRSSGRQPKFTKPKLGKDGFFGPAHLIPEGVPSGPSSQPTQENIAQARATQLLADRLQKLVELAEENNKPAKEVFPRKQAPAARALKIQENIKRAEADLLRKQARAARRQAAHLRLPQITRVGPNRFEEVPLTPERSMERLMADALADKLTKLVELAEENNRLQQQNVDQNQPRINRNGQMEPAALR